MTKKPNILLIMSDEHDPAVTGCYGDPLVKTPNLDRLAEGGVTFDGCYTTSPLCVPARLSFTAGKYVSRCGAWNNSCWLPSPDYPSLPGMLAKAGYECLLGGKMHYDRTRRYGFTDVIEGDNENESFKTGLGLADRRPPDSEEVNHASWKSRIKGFFVGGEEESRVMRLDGKRTTRACEFLSQRKCGDAPFFYLLGYIAPHFPLIAPRRYYDLYKDKVPMPALPAGWFEKLPTNYKQLIRGFGIDNEDRETVKKGRELYWALTSWMDAGIGKVLAALKNSEVADNTIVIYTSDHGENKGDHGLWWKNNMYEHSARIPLIVNFPARWAGGQRRAKACSLVDLVQTIADFAGAETPDDWDGDSLLPYLDDPDYDWKDFAVSEYYGHNVSSGFVMFRQGDYKYVYHTRMDETQGPERELYAMAGDPGEWNNLAGLPQYQERLAEMHRLLVKELGRDPEITERICRRETAIGYRRTDEKPQRPG